MTYNGLTTFQMLHTNCNVQIKNAHSPSLGVAPNTYKNEKKLMRSKTT